MRFDSAGEAFRWAMENYMAFSGGRAIAYDRAYGGRSPNFPPNTVCDALTIMIIASEKDITLKHAGSGLVYQFMPLPAEYPEHLTEKEQSLLDGCVDDFTRALEGHGYL